MLHKIKSLAIALGLSLYSGLSFADSAADADEHAILPQLEISTYPSQIFWLFVSFFVFYVLCSIFIVPRLRHLVQSRRDHLTSMMEETNEIALQAEKYHLRAEETIKKAKQQAHKDLSTKKTKLTSDFEKTAKKMAREAHKKISVKIENIKKNTRTVAPEMIERISSEITSEIIIKLSDIDPEVGLVKESVKKELSDKELVA